MKSSAGIRPTLSNSSLTFSSISASSSIILRSLSGSATMSNTLNLGLKDS